jgi:hypothetical protein
MPPKTKEAPNPEASTVVPVDIHLLDRFKLAGGAPFIRLTNKDNRAVVDTTTSIVYFEFGGRRQGWHMAQIPGIVTFL